MISRRHDIVLSPLEDGNQKHAIRTNADFVVLAGPTGSGKAQPLDSQVLTIDGWKKMGDIELGDKLVSPLNGEMSVVTGIYPQGVKPIYRVTTYDGRSTKCCLEHLWRFYTDKQVERTRKGCLSSFYVKTAGEIKDEYIDKGKNVYLPVALPYLGEKKNLPIDPYVLGVWLGDGCCHSQSFVISGDEKDVIEKVAHRLSTTYKFHGSNNYSNLFYNNAIVGDVKRKLKEFGLDTYSRLRFIPNIYLHASVEQRMELLLGLMDSDGYVDWKNRFLFSTTSPRLKENFVELCRSLGYVVSCSKEKRTKYKSGECWKITIQTNDIVFSSSKHLGKYCSNLRNNKSKNREYRHDFIRIKSIEYVGDMEAQCIMVSNRDHLYVTDDYLVTHNTFALYYAPIEYLAMNDNAKIVCFMRNVTDFWGAGKVGDTLKKMYPLIDRSLKKQPHDPIGELIHKQEDMGLKLYNGSEIKFQQLDNENPIVIDKIAKGLQAKKLIFDECNKFSWKTITSFMSRLRADSAGKAQIYLAQNPERECALRKLCGKGEHGGGWINDDGTIDKEMDGRVMFFYMQDGDMDKTYFGKTRREVYEKCKEAIDEKIARDPDMTYEDFILSMVFYTFDMRDNKKMLSKNKSYRAMTANSSTAKSSYDNNWNYSILDEESETDEALNTQLLQTDVDRMFSQIMIPSDSVLMMKRMTMDMASTGFDNLVMKYWELWTGVGWICKDIKYSMHNTSQQGALMAADFRFKHDLKESEMILDVQGFGFLGDCFPRATKFSGAGAASNRGKASFKSLKDEAGHLAMQMIQAGLIHYLPSVADSRYMHKNMVREGGTTVRKHMTFESRIFQFYKTPNNRLAMIEKEKMKKMLKGMSPDLFDNVILLCGGTCYDCYRMLSEDAGFKRERLDANSMLAMFNVNDTSSNESKPRKIRNSTEILNILSTI